MCSMDYCLSEQEYIHSPFGFDSYGRKDLLPPYHVIEGTADRPVLSWLPGIDIDEEDVKAFEGGQSSAKDMECKF